MNATDCKERLDTNIGFCFASQTHPEIERLFGSNKKIYSIGKSHGAACEWFLLSVSLKFQKLIKAEESNALIYPIRYYKKNTFRSETEYECHAGGIIAGVALQGDVVKIAE